MSASRSSATSRDGAAGRTPQPSSRTPAVNSGEATAATVANTRSRWARAARLRQRRLTTRPRASQRVDCQSRVHANVPVRDVAPSPNGLLIRELLAALVDHLAQSRQIVGTEILVGEQMLECGDRVAAANPVDELPERALSGLVA